jgi:prolyl oligopeptidase
MRSAVAPPPVTPIEPVTDVLHGVEITDPYRWLEDQSSPRTRKWIEEQTVYTRAYLDAIPGRERIRERVQQLLSIDVIDDPWKCGTRYFFLKRYSDSDQPVIVMRESAFSEDIPLVDPALRPDGSNASLSILAISPDGRLLAYEVRHNGEDPATVEFFDVPRRATLLDRLPRGSCRGLIFSAEGNGYYYSHEECDATHPAQRAVYWHTIGTPRETDSQVFVASEDSAIRLGLLSSQDGTMLVFLVAHLADPATVDVYVKDLAGGHAARKIVDKMGGLFSPFFVGNQLCAVTDWQAPNYRVVAVDTGAPQLEAWREVVPQSSSRIQDIAAVGGQIFVTYIENLETTVKAFHLAGQEQSMDCPSSGTIRLLNWQPENDTLFYRFTSFSHPPTVYYYNVHSEDQGVFARTAPPFDANSIGVERVWYRSKDGTQVPMSLVALKGSDPGPRPIFLTGYGGFGASVTPQYAAYTTFLIEGGCVIAIPQLRGGSEFGGQWHSAGKRHNRQNAIDDFIAAAEWLLAQGLATPGKVAIGGGSNAGLLVAAALTQRPELFRVVVCLGPFLDMLRYQKFDDAGVYAGEYGCSDNPDDFAALLSYSPYHNIRAGVSYPAVMFISGDADTRCNPMHARKMTARLQSVASAGYPMLLDYKPTWGHMPVQSLSNRIEALTDRLAFICDALCLNA